MTPEDLEDQAIRWLKLAGLVIAWVLVAVTMLACLFGCMLYNWTGP